MRIKDIDCGRHNSVYPNYTSTKSSMQSKPLPFLTHFSVFPCPSTIPTRTTPPSIYPSTHPPTYPLIAPFMIHPSSCLQEDLRRFGIKRRHARNRHHRHSALNTLRIVRNLQLVTVLDWQNLSYIYRHIESIHPSSHASIYNSFWLWDWP